MQPRLVYKDSVFHKQTNSTWAREDPAFVITLTLFMLAAAIAHGIAFSEPIVEFGFLILEAVVIHLYLASAALATAAWALASTRLKSDAASPHATGSAKVLAAHDLLLHAVLDRIMRVLCSSVGNARRRAFRAGCTLTSP